MYKSVLSCQPVSLSVCRTVSSEKGKSRFFAKKIFSPKILNFFAFRLLVKNAKNFLKISLEPVFRKMRNSREIRNAEFSLQNFRFLRIFFFAKQIFAYSIFAKFRIVSTFFSLYSFSQKMLNFAKCERKFFHEGFRSL